MKKMPTKEKIIYAALDLISEKGYDGVGVDLIAEHAGLKGPSLYRHFKGKEDIFRSIIDMVEIHYEEGFGLRSAEEAIPDSLDALVENAMKRILFTMNDESVRKTRRIMAMEQFRNERIAEMTSRYHLDNLQALYAKIFAGMMEKGLLVQDDPECLALEFAAPVSLLIHMHDRQPERETEIMEKIRKHMEHFVKVYGK